MASVIRIIAEEASFCDQAFEDMLEASMRGVGLTYTPVAERAEAVSPHDCWFGVDPAAEGSTPTVTGITTISEMLRENSSTYRPANAWHCLYVQGDDEAAGDREHRFDKLRAEGKKLGEINAILEAEGYSEVFGEGVMPAPTKSHQIVRENKGARQMVEAMGGQ